MGIAYFQYMTRWPCIEGVKGQGALLDPKAPVTTTSWSRNSRLIFLSYGNVPFDYNLFFGHCLSSV